MEKNEPPKSQDADWRKVMENGYMGLIKGSLNRIAVLGHDTILNNIIRLLINVSDDSNNEKPNADEVLIATDKFYIFKNMWKPILEILYEKYLPSINYEFDWTIEATPYTLTICHITSQKEKSVELLHFMNLANITEKDVENDYNVVVENLGLASMNLNGHLENRLSKKTLPESNKER